jgi:hypothetical protein
MAEKQEKTVTEVDEDLGISIGVSARTIQSWKSQISVPNEIPERKFWDLTLQILVRNAD